MNQFDSTETGKGLLKDAYTDIKDSGKELSAMLKKKRDKMLENIKSKAGSEPEPKEEE